VALDARLQAGNDVIWVELFNEHRAQDKAI
jgi:hypothetical protein